MILHSLIVAALFGSAVPTQPAAIRSPLARAGDAAPPGIRLWTSHSEVYSRGERVRVFFRTEQNAYVTILRVDTDGRVRVLFPREPWEDNAVRGGYTYDVPNYGRHEAFIVDDDPGVGYVFGVASTDQFAFEAFSSANRWDLQLVSDGGRIHGDPYQSLEELVQRIIPAGYTDYDTHLLPYHVERRYDYPRFVCYDCHTYTGYSFWNPYANWCPRFTLFVYNDPFYYYPSYWYPTRYYGGTRVVFVSPGERGSRYVFKTREDQSAPSIAYRDRRRDETAGRQPADRGVRGADIGGVGTIPSPGGRRTVGNDAGSPAGGGRQTPETRIPLIGGSAQTPGRREAQTPSVTTGVAKTPDPSDAARRRPVTPTAGRGTQRVSQPTAERPRGVIIDPYAAPKAQPEARPESRNPSADPSDAGKRRSEPVYLGGQPSRTENRPESRAQAERQSETPRAEPRSSNPSPRAEPRSSSPQPHAEPRPSSPPSRAEPRSSSPPSRAEPRSSSPPPSRPSSQPASTPRRRT